MNGSLVTNNVMVMKTHSVAFASCDEEVVFFAVSFIGIPQKFNTVLPIKSISISLCISVCFVIARK